MDNLLFPILLVFCLFNHVSANEEICVEDICEYELVIRHARTLAWKGPKKWYTVALNDTKLEVTESMENIAPNDLFGKVVGQEEVITADGYLRTIITINGQFPGPSIQVQEGSQVAVRVVNGLLLETVTVHWHGMYMQGTPWMDGVPFVSQCPIQSGQSFTYRFIAQPIGTHWYHSHMTGQKLDGVYGLLVVHPKNKHPVLPEFPLMLGDFNHVQGDVLEIISPSSNIKPNRGTGEDIFVNPKYRDYSHDGVNAAALGWISGLINGRGRHDIQKKFPLFKFRVTRGQTYRFRCVNVGGEFSLKISIDGHVLRVVASDGHDIEAVEVEYILINPGETIDFEVDFNQIEGRYWLRADTLNDYSKYPTWDGKQHGVRAVVIYDPLDDSGEDPMSHPRPCTANNLCREFNCPYGSFPPTYNRTCVNFDQVHSTASHPYLQEHFGVDDTNEDVEEVFLNIAYVGGASMNARRMQKPSAPFYQSDSVTIQCDCEDWSDACPCTYIVPLNFNKTYQIIFSNMQDVPYVGHHPMHVHGHAFAVMHIGYAEHDPVTGRWTRKNQDIQCKDDVCSALKWTNDQRPVTFSATSRPAIKDTVIVPARGYTVVRLRSTNPGYWLFHCHMNHHLENGMAGLFGEAIDRIPPVAKGQPSCSSFHYTENEFEDQIKKSNMYLKHAANIMDSDTSSGSGANDMDSHEDKKEVECKAKEGYHSLPFGEFLGICLGCVILGVVLCVVPLLLYINCSKSNTVDPSIKHHHYKEQQVTDVERF